MFSGKSKVVLLLMVLFAFLVFDAFAEGLSGKAVVALGSAKLSVTSGSETQIANNSSINASAINTTSINLSAINNTLMNLSAINNTSMNDSTTNISTIANLSSKNKLMDKPARIVPVMDLSRYAKDRLNKSLGGYRNIIYPMAESSGFTAGTGGSGSGGGGGCGCGG